MIQLEPTQFEVEFGAQMDAPMRQNPLFTELSWWKSETRDVAGIVLQDNTDSNYAYVVIGFEDGAYRAINLGTDLDTVDQVKSELDSFLR